MSKQLYEILTFDQRGIGIAAAIVARCYGKCSGCDNVEERLESRALQKLRKQMEAER